MIGIIGAMDVEVEAIEALMDSKEVINFGKKSFTKGTIKGKDVVVATAGMGKVSAAICTQTMIMAFKPDCIVNTGIAGSLTSEIGICDVVVGDSFVQHDVDASAIGDELGFITGIDLVYIPGDEKVKTLLFEAAQKSDVKKVICGRIASGDQFVASEEKKNFIVNTFGAKCCEMEGAAIAQTCYTAGVPFGVIRAMSDCVDGSSHINYFDLKPIAAKIASDIMADFVEKW